MELDSNVEHNSILEIPCHKYGTIDPRNLALFVSGNILPILSLCQGRARFLCQSDKFTA